MPRPLRLEVAGGVYHITARGNRRQAIFGDDIDRRRFLDLFDAALRRHKWRQRAYCLMSNHYHLFIETPEPTLSTGMHYLNGVYAKKFNERHVVDGHLFEARFGSELIETEAHFGEVLRYVAFNPVRAGLCEHPADWPWSSWAGVDARFLFDR
jgi:REP element-mobilizing transposase RayT